MNAPKRLWSVQWDSRNPYFWKLHWSGTEIVEADSEGEARELVRRMAARDHGTTPGNIVIDTVTPIGRAS